MQLFPTLGEDLLDAASLPNTAFQTELNYRTRPMSAEMEFRLTLLIFLGPVFALVALASILSGLFWTNRFFELLTVSTIILLALRLGYRKLIGVSVRHNLAAFIGLDFAYIVAKLWHAVDAIWWAPLAIASSWIVCCLITRQIAVWILVNPKVDLDTMARWKFNLPDAFQPKLSLECPELLNFALSPLLLVPTWWLAVYLSANFLGGFWMWPICYVICLHFVWLVMHTFTIALVPWPDVVSCWRMTLRAIVVFTTYDVHQTPAAGVFRFPTLWLRHFVCRWLLLVSVLLVLAFASYSACPDPAERFSHGGSYLGQLCINWIAITLEAPVLFLTIMWFTSGALLVRFETELTKTDPASPSEWDNYVDRIVNSGDDLEREHFFAGTSSTGDYPILVHREILDQHMHVLGDSGASKTSLGIAPLVTQLIARGDSTVVVVDLKGDKALFEGCKMEAARTQQLPFRWLSNEVGMSSFAFNPFGQKHNRKLSIEQFVQELLQGLSLDHGIAYGAGYFTSMNEIVLTTILRNYRVRSFRELDRYLSNRQLYSKIGNKNDWDQARHLGVLVSRLASSEVINVIPGRYPDQPEVHAQAIDAMNLLEIPQVVYLWLRSAVEPINAPTIARLFLWAMFSAASHRPKGKQRVYFLIDEFQQVISDGIKLIFEQYRDLGGTIIAAHQTVGQLRRPGIDLLDTIDSCTAVKQVFRASDLNSLERLEKLSGSRLARLANWVQPHEMLTGDIIDRLDPLHAVEGLLRVRENEQPRLDRRRLMEISSRRLSSLVRFTFGSGYTQFAGASVPISSIYSISFEEYERRRSLPPPTAEGAFTIQATPMNVAKPSKKSNRQPASERQPDNFVKEFDRRGKPPVSFSN